MWPRFDVQLHYQGHQLQHWQCHSVDCIFFTQTHTYTHACRWIEGWWMGDAVAMALTRSWYKFGGYKRLCHCVSNMCGWFHSACSVRFCLSVCLYICMWGRNDRCVCVRTRARKSEKDGQMSRDRYGGKMIGVKWERTTKRGMGGGAESGSENVFRMRDWGHVLITAFPAPACALIIAVCLTMAGLGHGFPLNTASNLWREHWDPGWDVFIYQNRSNCTTITFILVNGFYLHLCTK